MEYEHQSIGDNVRPSNYKITIDTNLKRFKFAGKIEIEIKAAKPTNAIKLYSKELVIKNARLLNGKEEQNATFTLDREKEILTLKFKNPFSSAAKLTIDYEGVNNDKLYGFYRSKYENRGKTGYILTSQFEAPNARAAFPCFDEPEFKATFDLSLIVDNNHDAVSNMPIRATAKNGKRKTVTFQTTPIMSSYLLYMGVGKFDRLSTKQGRRTISIITVQGKKNLAKLSMGYATRVLAYYEKYFGIGYPLPKLDFIAVPDFAAGAMENWGAITFREADLLGDTMKTAIAQKQRIAEVLSHEVAHQWFGDLVTMKWWDDMWLNESFAQYMEMMALNKIYPEWKMLEKFYNSIVALAMGADSLRNTHPIYMQVNTAEEIEVLFDAIGYDKGASVLFMLENYVGHEAFRSGVSKYLKKFSYSNATKTDLWASIQDAARASGMRDDVVGVMTDWITRAGYPIITVTRNSDGSFQLEQEKFTISGNVKGDVWKIPINYLTSDGEHKILFDRQSDRIQTKSEWIKLNYQQTGFYRVKYDNYNLARLGKMFKKGELNDIDMWGLEADLFAIARSGSIKARDYLTFVSRYCMDSGYPVNNNIIGHLAGLIGIAYNETFTDEIRSVCINFCRKQLDKIGLAPRPNESSVNTKLRSAALGALSYAGDKETQSRLYKIFRDFVDKKIEIDGDIKLAVFQNAAFYYGDSKMFKLFLELYNKAELPETKIRALVSLPNFGTKEFVEQSLECALNGKIRMQDTPFVFGYAASNPMATDLFYKWMKSNWKRIMQMYNSPSTRMLSNAVSDFAVLNDQKSRNDLEKFFKIKSNNRSDIEREVLKTLEKIDANIRFIEANKLGTSV